MLLDELLCLRCARDSLVDERRYCRAGWKGLGVSVFRAENMDLYGGTGVHLGGFSGGSRWEHIVVFASEE